MLTPVQRSTLGAPRSIGVTSPAFTHGRQIPREHTGFGDDTRPPLRFRGLPKETQAIAIVVDDPDAPGGTFTHWTVWNLPPRIDRLDAGAKVVPLGGIEGVTDWGSTGWRGPKPPSGTHRYFFRVFALDRRLDLPQGASIEDVWGELSTHTLAWGELIGTCTKP